MSAKKSREQKIRSFFDDAGGAGLILPSGWFGGRPWENYHQLTFIADRHHHLIVELDDQVLLIFSGQTEITVQQSGLALTSGTTTLTISGFSQLVVDRLGYGDLIPHAQVFSEGSVQFLATN